MSEDPTRATPRSPRHGSVGPLDPHADPATDPGMRPVGPTTGPIERVPPARQDEQPTQPVGSRPVEPEQPTEPVRRGQVTPGHTRTGGLYVGLVLSALVLVVLLIFILQNLRAVRIEFLGFGGDLPVGVAMLLSAVAGLLLVAIPGGLRIWQLRRAVRRADQRH